MAKAVKRNLKTPQLANKPSECIIQAVADLVSVEKIKKTYTVDMNTFHEHEGNGLRCSVCFAGAVIARAGNDPKVYIEPSYFPDDVRNKLHALDDFRNGDLSNGLRRFGVKKIPIVLQSEYVNITDYQDNPKQFKKDMLELASNLTLLGL